MSNIQTAARECIEVSRSSPYGGFRAVTAVLQKHFGQDQEKMAEVKDAFMWEHRCRVDLEHAKQILEQDTNATIADLNAKLIKAREMIKQYTKPPECSCVIVVPVPGPDGKTRDYHPEGCPYARYIYMLKEIDDE